MSLEFQRVWHDLIVVDLFFGGLGGACMMLAALALYSERLLALAAPWTGSLLRRAAKSSETAAPNRTLILVLSLSGVVFVGIGVLMLILDLLHPEAVLYLLTNPTSWMFWGSVFISFTLIAGVLFSWAQAVPLLEWLGRHGKHLGGLFNWLARVGRALQQGERFLGVWAGSFGFAYASYTGLLLTVAPAISFWNTPALPLLFLVSAFSAAAAYAMIVLAVLRGMGMIQVQRLYGSDVGLIAFELLILLAYLNFAWVGPVGTSTSIDYLFSQTGFWLGALLVGLILPLGLELLSVLRHGATRFSAALSIVSGVSVLVGVYLLRYYVVHAGVFEFPW